MAMPGHRGTVHVMTVTGKSATASSRRPRTVLVCSGGGVYGAAQVGMIAELAEAGFVPDAIVGISAGAMNGVYMSKAFTADRASELVAIWSSLTRRSVFPARPAALLWNIVARRDAVHPDDGLRKLVTRCSPYYDLTEATIPVHVGAVAVNSGRLVWWDTGDVINRLCASAAIPGVIPPVDIDGEYFFDGGVVSNVPLQRAVMLGAERVVVLDVAENSFTGHPTSALDTVLRAFSHARTALADREYRAAPGHVEVIRIGGEMPDVDSADFGRCSELIGVGRALAARALENHPGLVAHTEEPHPRSILGRFRRLFRTRH